MGTNVTISRQEEPEHALDAIASKIRPLISAITNLMMGSLTEVISVYLSETGFTLFAMVMSFLVLIIMTVEVVCRGRAERVTWRRHGCLYWFYHPSPSCESFGTLNDVLGFIGAATECVYASLAFHYSLTQGKKPLKYFPLPFILAVVQLLVYVYRK